MTQLSEESIVLVQPLGYRPETVAGDISRLASCVPPLGLLSLAAYLEGDGISATVFDCYADPGSESLMIEHLRSQRPAFFGLSCTTSNFLDGVRLAELARDTVDGIQVVVGGPHVSALRESILERFEAIDFVVVGEGEEPLEKLIRSGGGNPGEIPGLVYREEGKVHFNGFQVKALDLDSLPFPAYDKLDGYPAAYKLPLFNYPRSPHTSCVSSRGCPYACSYCDRSVFRRRFTANSAEYLYEHLRYLKTDFGIRHVTFYDDQFTFDRQRIEKVVGLLERRPLDITFCCAVRAEHVDSALLALLKAAGCWMISLGIETGDEQLLARHRKNANLEMVADKVRQIKQAGIRVKGLLMMGLPGETRASIERSMEYVFGLPLDELNIAKFTPFPGSPIYEKAHELGEFDEDWSAMDCMSFQFIPKGMSRAELEQLFKAFYKAHFLRPRILMGYLAMIWRSPESWLRFMRHCGSFLRFARSNQRFEVAVGD
jgi:anaerobic magnesium-protoporphyrin IX monomethyl ester cyclase